MLPAVRNLFDESRGFKDEVIIPIVREAACRLEHIVSNGARSAPDFWYDQDKPEWVALVRGQATLEFEDGQLALKAGDSLTIPAHRKHRVAFTSADAVWLALHFTNDPQPRGA
jgi:cupin 2 domain-containing protein